MVIYATSLNAADRSALTSVQRQRFTALIAWLVLQDNGALVGFALAGGVFLVLGNIGTQYALAYCGLSITEVVSSSITVVGGVRKLTTDCSPPVLHQMLLKC